MEEDEGSGLQTKPTHRRSRRGCRTCRLRRKKCSEVYNSDGVCERCAAGGWECDRSPLPASRLPAERQQGSGLEGIRRKRCNNVHSAAGNCANCEDGGSAHDRSSRPAGRLPPERSRSIPGPERSGSNQSTSSTSTSHSLVSSTSTSTAASSATSILESGVGPFAFLPHPQSGMFTESMSLSPGRHASPGLLDTPESAPFPPVYRPYSLQHTPVASPPSILGAAGGPSGALETHIRSQPSGSSSRIGKELSCTLMEWRIRQLGERELGRNPDAEGLAGEDTEASDLAAARSYYEEVDDGITLSIPDSTRHLYRPRVLEATFTKELPRLAALAMCTSIRRSLATLGGSGEGEQLAIRAQKYYQRAMGALQVDASPVDIRLGALLDLARFQMEQHGAGAGYSSFSICDLYITSILGPSAIPYSPLLPPAANILFRHLALNDVLRAVALNRRTLFSFQGGPSPYALPAILLDGEFIAGDNDFMRGVPVHLVLCIAAACNLAQDEATMEPGQFLGQATLIERAIEGWQSTSTMDGEEEEQLFHRATAEMWRHAALVHLRTTLFHLGPLHTSIRNSLKLIFTFGSRRYGVNSPLSIDVHGLPAGSVLERSFPWFMAATVSLQDADRDRCRVAIGMGLPMKSAKERLHCASRIWELTDGCGFPINWTSALASEGLFVAF